MTTLIVNAHKSVIFSDSRRTLTCNGKTWYDGEGEKIFKHKSGKLLAGMTGNMNIAFPELQRKGFILNRTDIDGQDTMQKGESCNIFIINKHNDHILQLQATRGRMGKVSFTKKYITKWNHLWGGSGGDVITKLYTKDNDLCEKKAIHYAAMSDKYTDDRIVEVRL